MISWRTFINFLVALAEYRAKGVWPLNWGYFWPHEIWNADPLSVLRSKVPVISLIYYLENLSCSTCPAFFQLFEALKSPTANLDSLDPKTNFSAGISQKFLILVNLFWLIWIGLTFQVHSVSHLINFHTFFKWILQMFNLFLQRTISQVPFSPASSNDK